MLIKILYEFLIFLLFLLWIPKFLYNKIFYSKYQALFKRLGFGFPEIQKKEKRFTIWIHAVSLGETKAIISLAKKIKLQFPESILIISNTTETGHEEAKRALSFADYRVFFPLDFLFVMSPLLGKVKPDLVIVTENDFWWNFLRLSKLNGASICVVNGKLSERSEKRFNKFKFFSDKIFSEIDLFCVQNLEYKERFKQLDIDDKKIVITGNMKLEAEGSKLSIEERDKLKNQLGILPHQEVLVLGSTHFPEEELFLDSLVKIWVKFPSLKVLLAPRHPERFEEVALLLETREILFSRMSENHEFKKEALVVLVDVMGRLKECYQLATIAVVAGSYTEKIGGHNIMEPCEYGVPVIFGPYMYSQKELERHVLQAAAGLQVSRENLTEEIFKLLSDTRMCQQMGVNGEKLFSSMHGSSQCTMDAINLLLQKKKSVV